MFESLHPSQSLFLHWLACLPRTKYYIKAVDYQFTFHKCFGLAYQDSFGLRIGVLVLSFLLAPKPLFILFFRLQMYGLTVTFSDLQQ